MKNKLIPVTAFSALSIAIAFVMLSTSALAEDTAGNQPACDKIESASERQKCADDQKRSQLKSVKLQPEIRKEDIKKDSPLNPSALYPFIVGAGRIQ